MARLPLPGPTGRRACGTQGSGGPEKPKTEAERPGPGYSRALCARDGGGEQPGPWHRRGCQPVAVRSCHDLGMASVLAAGRAAPAVWAGSEDRVRRDQAEDSEGEDAAAAARTHWGPGPRRAEKWGAGGAGDGGGAAGAWVRPGLFAWQQHRLMQQGLERLRLSALRRVPGAAPGGAVPRETAARQGLVRA
jgi:hypothetical protein